MLLDLIFSNQKIYILCSIILLMSKLRQLEKKLGSYLPLSPEWHSALIKYTERLIKETAPIRALCEKEERRYSIGF